MKTQHFEIQWPEDLRPQKVFPSILSDAFQPLYTGLDNTWLTGNSGRLAVQRLAGGEFHFGTLQSNLSEPRIFRIHTAIPTLFFTACQIGHPHWEFSGQPMAVNALPGTHHAVALPSSETVLHLPAGVCQVTCFIMAGHRLQLIARDLPFLQPAIDALQNDREHEARLLPTCPTLQDIRENLDYLRTKKLDSTAQRNLCYKKKLHAILACYNDQLALRHDRQAHSKERLYNAAVALLRDSSTAVPTVHELAETLHVSVRTLQHAFKAHGTTYTRCRDENRQSPFSLD